MKLTLDLTGEQAWALAQYLKRIGYADYREKSASDEEAWKMFEAGEAVRAALADAGCAPR